MKWNWVKVGSKCEWMVDIWRLIECLRDCSTCEDGEGSVGSLRFLEGDVFVFDEDRGFEVSSSIWENRLDFLEDVTLGSFVDGRVDRIGLLLSRTEELVRYIVEAVYRVRREGEGSCLLREGSQMDRDALDVTLVLNFGRVEAYGRVSAESMSWRQGLFARICEAVRECPVSWFGEEVF